MNLPALLLLAAGAALAADARFVAGSAVSSKEWRVRREPKKEEEFLGDVHYDAAGLRLASDWALYRHDAEDWTARGHVYARRRLRSGDVVEVRGESARYDGRRHGGELEPAPGGRIAFSRAPAEGEPDRGESDHFSWENEHVATLSGRARVWGPRVEFWSDAARYEREPERRLLLDGGRPVMRKLEGDWILAAKADRIVATDAPRRILALGAVKGWLFFTDTRKLKELAK